MNTLWQDISYGLRILKKSPGFTAIAVFALALGIASTTAIFSVVDAVPIHSLPYPDSDRIVFVSQSQRSTGEPNGASSPANYLDWAAQNHAGQLHSCATGGKGRSHGGAAVRVRINL